MSQFYQTYRRVHTFSKMGDFLHSREADQICSKSESCPLSCSNTNTWRHSIQDSEHDRGQNGQSGDLVKRECFLRDKDSSRSNNKTLDQIFDNSINNFCKSVAHHFSIFNPKKKTRNIFDSV